MWREEDLSGSAKAADQSSDTPQWIRRRTAAVRYPWELAHIMLRAGGPPGSLACIAGWSSVAALGR